MSYRQWYQKVNISSSPIDFVGIARIKHRYIGTVFREHSFSLDPGDIPRRTVNCRKGRCRRKHSIYRRSDNISRQASASHRKRRQGNISRARTRLPSQLSGTVTTWECALCL